MLGIILIAGTFFIAALVHSIYKNKYRPKESVSLILIIFSMMTVGGILLILWQQSLVREGLSRRSWPTVTGTVVSADITGNRAYNPKITCRYQVSGKNYLLVTDLHTPAFGRKRARHQTAEIIIAEYPPGSHITVHYNPVQPGQACIRPGPFWNNYLLLTLGLFAFGGGSFGLMTIYDRLKN
jgi:hypothetical protein